MLQREQAVKGLKLVIIKYLMQLTYHKTQVPVKIAEAI